MPRMQVQKQKVKNILSLILAVVLVAGLLGGISFWESNKRAQAVLKQEEIDEPAKRRREGWIEKDGKWYAPKIDQETLLLIGIDKTEPLQSSGSYNNDGQADFLLLVIFEEDKGINMLHINRDLMTDIPVLGVTGQPAGTIFAQLALSHTYGSGLQDSCANTVKAVSMLLNGVKIDHYVGMTMGAVPLINDMVKGVPVTIMDDFTGIDNSLVKGKEIVLNGQQAISYIRMRQGLEDSSNLNRMKRQQQYLQAFVNRVHELGEDYSPSASQLSELSKYLVSDCSMQELNRIAKKFAKVPMMGMADIKGEAKKGTEYMEFYPDKEALENQILDLFYTVKD